MTLPSSVQRYYNSCIIPKSYEEKEPLLTKQLLNHYITLSTHHSLSFCTLHKLTLKINNYNRNYSLLIV